MTVATTAAQECCRLTPVYPRCRCEKLAMALSLQTEFYDVSN